MSKVKSGDIVTKITQKAVEIMGPLGYSREYLLESGSGMPKLPTSTKAPARSTDWSWRGRFGLLWKRIEVGIK